MFSSRYRNLPATNRLSRLLADYRCRGVSVLDLTVSNPTMVGLQLPSPDVSWNESDPYRPDASGSIEARAAISSYYQGRQVELNPSDLLLTAGSSQAYSFLFKILLDPGEVVLVPRPSYPLFEHLTQAEAVTPLPYDLLIDEGWRLDLDQIEAAFDQGARLLLLVHPNNPTGSYIGVSEWEEVKQLCLRYSAIVICDEVFLDYPLETPGPEITGDSDQPLVLLNGLSKLAALPQVKLAWMALLGPSRFKEQIKPRLELVSDTFLSVSSVAEQMAIAVLPENRRHDRVLSRVQQNYRCLQDHLKETAVEVLPASGGWSAILRVPSLWDEEDWALRLLEKQKLLVHPGFFYEMPRESYLVVSLLAQPERVRHGIDRLLREIP